jgi:hypothetical protein
MSHFTKCDLKLTNLEAIKRAVEDMEYTVRMGEQGQKVVCRGYRGDTLQADIVIDMGTYDIGVVEAENGTYDLVADWWGVETTKGISEEEFKNKINQKYAYHNVKIACEGKGYTVEEETNEEDGTVNLIVRKWVSD